MTSGATYCGVPHCVLICCNSSCAIFFARPKSAILTSGALFSPAGHCTRMFSSFKSLWLMWLRRIACSNQMHLRSLVMKSIRVLITHWLAILVTHLPGLSNTQRHLALKLQDSSLRTKLQKDVAKLENQLTGFARLTLHGGSQCLSAAARSTLEHRPHCNSLSAEPSLPTLHR